MTIWRTLTTTKIFKVHNQETTGKQPASAVIVEDAESSLQHGDNVGSVCKGKQGLGTVTEPTTMWKNANSKNRRHLVHARRDKGMKPGEETRYGKAVQMGIIGKEPGQSGILSRENNCWHGTNMKYKSYQLQFFC
jgi:hypothetical protein